MNASQCATQHDLHAAVRMTIISVALCLAAALTISIISDRTIPRMNHHDVKAAVHEALIELRLSKNTDGQ